MKKLTTIILSSFFLLSCGSEQQQECLTNNNEIIVGGSSGFELSDVQIFKKNNGAEPGTLDPHRAEGVPASNVLRDLYEGLVGEKPNGEYIPGAAESWEISEDSKTYTFKIRRDAKWSNGDEVVAEDFVFSLRRSVDPQTLSNYSSMLYPIKNAREIVLGNLATEALGVYSTDRKTFVVELEEPTPYFLSLLTHSTTYPVHPKSIEKYGASFTRPVSYTHLTLPTILLV